MSSKICYYFGIVCSNMGWRLAIIAPIWLVFITYAHFELNVESIDRKQITMGYMPVVTNLASPLLDYATKDTAGTRFKALKYASFAELAESLRNGEIDAAFLIAPLSVVLRQQGADIKIVYIGNRHESTLVARKELQVKNLHDLVGKTVAVPMRYSGHNLSILQMIEDKGLQGRINIVEMNPPDMASALASGALDAYYVGEPFAAQTLMSGDAELVTYAEDVWKDFICNLTVVRQDLIERDPDAVKLLVESAARSGVWAGDNPKEAAEIASLYWNQPAELVEYAMKTPDNHKRVLFDKFIPKEKEMQYMADLMQHFGLLESNDITGLVDDQFARSANLENVVNMDSIVLD